MRRAVGGLLMVSLIAAPVHGVAQIAALPSAAAMHRPQVLMTPNGVPMVNITAPSAAGVSRNIYQQFDVDRKGAILNNSRTGAQTNLGGAVGSNPWLANGAARVILNEVRSNDPSLLRGPVEVAGQRGEVVIANPSGIQVDGGAFINASRATLTTGTPEVNALGGLERYVVRDGTITVDGAGLDLSRTDYGAILARAIKVNSAIWANYLQATGGANDIDAATGEAKPVEGRGERPQFRLDVALLGGMYAGKIFLNGTEHGLGVRNFGTLSSTGDLILTSDGKLVNKGTIEAASVKIKSAEGIDNQGGTIRQTQALGLAVTAANLQNAGGTIGAEPVRPPPAPNGNAPGGGDAGNGAGGTGGAGGSGSLYGRDEFGDVKPGAIELARTLAGVAAGLAGLDAKDIGYAAAAGANAAANNALSLRGSAKLMQALRACASGSAATCDLVQLRAEMEEDSKKQAERIESACTGSSNLDKCTGVVVRANLSLNNLITSYLYSDTEEKKDLVSDLVSRQVSDMTQTYEALGVQHSSASARELLAGAITSAMQITGMAGIKWSTGHGVSSNQTCANGKCQAASAGARSIDELSQAAAAADRGGLTAAGRALQKHGGREGSAFPAAKGNPLFVNQQGQHVVDDILTSPGSTMVTRNHARFGEVTEVWAPDGRGLRYGADGKFIGFLEPNK
ncbi:exported hypothetical protein [Burkholderiales bacterium 8X]|nr:exported hypothetical protein [Burkholderiales bacterium 8X]